MGREISTQIFFYIKIMEFWNKERILNDVKKYKSLPEIRKENSKLHNAITRYKLIEEVYKLIGKTGNRYNKCIYSYEFPDNYVYVGLTYDIEKRQKDRDNNQKDSVTEHIILTGLQPIRKQLTDYIPVDEAIELEGYYLNKYIDDGWIKLNKTSTGAIGGEVVKWTKESCRLEALKYNNKKDFRNKSSSAYVTTKHNKWIDELCSHMLEIKKSNGFWTKEKCAEIAKEYNNITELDKNYPSCYVIMKRNKWIDELTTHMNISNRKPIKYWNYDTCLEAALIYTNKKDFKEQSQGAYTYARKHNFLNKIFETVKYDIKFNPSDYWSYDRCYKEALKYNNKKDFKNNSSQSYRVSYKNRWIDQICNHMIQKEKPSKYWTYEKCSEEALKYKHFSDFKKESAGACHFAWKNNYTKEITSHMIRKTSNKL